MSRMNKMRLFTSPSAFPNPQRVRLLMHEKGIVGEIEEVLLDMAPAGGAGLAELSHLKG